MSGSPEPEVSGSPGPGLLDLPGDALQLVLGSLATDHRDLVALEGVCTFFRSLLASVGSAWRSACAVRWAGKPRLRLDGPDREEDPAGRTWKERFRDAEVESRQPLSTATLKKLRWAEWHTQTPQRWPSQGAVSTLREEQRARSQPYYAFACCRWFLSFKNGERVFNVREVKFHTKKILVPGFPLLSYELQPEGEFDQVPCDLSPSHSNPSHPFAPWQPAPTPRHPEEQQQSPPVPIFFQSQATMPHHRKNTFACGLTYRGVEWPCRC